jgi:hypothetical protein
MKRVLFILIMLLMPVVMYAQTETPTETPTPTDTPTMTPTNTPTQTALPAAAPLRRTAIDAQDVYASRAINYYLDDGTNDAYVLRSANTDIAQTAYAVGHMVIFIAKTANTGACTVNVNGLGAKSLKMLHDQDPADNYIEVGSMVMAIYDGTNYQLISPDANP